MNIIVTKDDMTKNTHVSVAIDKDIIYTVLYITIKRMKKLSRWRTSHRSCMFNMV